MAMAMAMATASTCALCRDGRRRPSPSSPSLPSASSSFFGLAAASGRPRKLRLSPSPLPGRQKDRDRDRDRDRVRSEALYAEHGAPDGPAASPPAVESEDEIVIGGKTREERREEGGGSVQVLLSASLGLLTPIRVTKWAAIGAVCLAAARAACQALLHPSSWTYASWFLVVWPLPTAVALGLWSLWLAIAAGPGARKRTSVKKKDRSAKEREQLVALAGALTWLILVPLGLRNGYIEGWPLTLFFAYMYTFLVSAIVRYGRYLELNPIPPRERQWSSSPPRNAQVAFVASIVLGHWIAAFEGPNLYFAWNWHLPSQIAAAFVAFSAVLHYAATYFLSKYSDKFMDPTAIVVFGPYRFVRHPIYASFMLLFAGYSIALRAYWSLALLLAASLLYYQRRADIEESLLEKAFPGQYQAYKDKVKYKFFWLVY